MDQRYPNPLRTTRAQVPIPLLTMQLDFCDVYRGLGRRRRHQSSGYCAISKEGSHRVYHSVLADYPGLRPLTLYYGIPQITNGCIFNAVAR